MKTSLLPLISLLASCALPAGEPPAAAPEYVDEAPLPKGWPAPGPYDRVTEKNYPAYRAAFTSGDGETGAFWRLFTHIKKNDIPMTAPVEMGMDVEGDRMKQNSMAFLYQSDEVGAEGPAGGKVEVRDVEAARTLSYAWMGDDSKADKARARAALDQALAERKLTAKSFRLLGYNGPGTPRDKRTWELQAVLD